MRLKAFGAAAAALAALAMAGCRSSGRTSDLDAVMSDGPLIDGPIAAKDAHWTQLPSGKAVMALYPAKARAQKLEGRTRIRCRIKPSGELARCVVLDEIPAGYGFGAADIKFAKRLRLPAGRYGPHATVEAPIDWRLGP